jgi:muramoyltetrapeptide carboxypeptidase
MSYNVATNQRASEGHVVLTKPKHLRPGDTIAIVSPSSPPPNDSDFERIRRWVVAQGFQVKEFPHTRDRWGYYAGADADRAADLTAAFADPEVNGILVTRGGTGGWRMAPHIDFEVVRANPKFFCGHSDITAPHLAIAMEAQLLTFYGPVAMSFARGKSSTYTTRHFLRAATTPEPLGMIEKDPDDPFTWAIAGGVAEGPLLGGCLSLLVAAVGTRWAPDWRGAIVFFEDVHEDPYRIDNYLTQLRLAGHFEGIAGVVVGEHADCRPKLPASFTLEEVYRQHFHNQGVPVMVGLPCGHGTHITTLPLGVRARLDADALTLELLEAGTV